MAKQRETIQREYVSKAVKRKLAHVPSYPSTGKDQKVGNYYYQDGYRAALRWVLGWLKGEVRRTRRKGGIGR